MQSGKYEYSGETSPDLNQPEYWDFLLLLQKAVVFSLEKRELLTHAQAEKCVNKLQKLHTKKHSKHRI